MTDDSLTKREAYEILKGVWNHVLFEYKGKSGCVDPIGPEEYYLTFDGKTIEVNNFDKAVNTPFIEGKSFDEIYYELDYVE